MLRSVCFVFVAHSSALAFQSGAAHARSAAAVHSAAAVRSAAAMMSDPDATRDSGEDVVDEARAALLARLKAPIRQYEGGWGDRALRNGGVDNARIGKGPTPHLIGTQDRFEEAVAACVADSVAGTNGPTPTLSPEKQAQLVLPEESFKIKKMAMSQTDEDHVMECAFDEGVTEGEMVLEIDPEFSTPQEYFFGFTADSDPKISIDYGASSSIEGEMPAKHEKGRVTIKLKFKPEYVVGEHDAYLCCILPNQANFPKFYKITGKSTSA